LFTDDEVVKAKGANLQISQTTPIGTFNALGSWDESSNVGTSPAFAGALAGGFEGINYIQNVEDESWSGELNFASEKFGRFSFIAGGNYYHNLGLVQTPIMSANGKQVPRAPKATLSLSATYSKELPAGLFSLTANGYASERIYFDVGNVFSQPSYATLGLRASFSPSSFPGLTASVWGNNLTNNSVILSTFLNSNAALASYAPPRTYGATLSYKF